MANVSSLTKISPKVYAAHLNVLAETKEEFKKAKTSVFVRKHSKHFIM